jgi:hypothetical protein
MSNAPGDLGDFRALYEIASQVSSALETEIGRAHV